MAEAVIELVRRLPSPPPGAEEPTGLQLPLTAEQRTVLRGRRRALRPRCVAAVATGWGLAVLAIGSRMPVVTSRWRWWQRLSLLQVQATSALELLQAAYHLGNRHVALELHERELLLLEDSVLQQMLESRGLSEPLRAALPAGGWGLRRWSAPQPHAQPSAFMTSLALLQLVSPASPVGAFSYSEGLEVLVQAGALKDGDPRAVVEGRAEAGDVAVGGLLPVAVR